jgi:hypothetical protein
MPVNSKENAMYRTIPACPPPITRPKSFLDRLGVYAVAATAAGVGAIATSEPVEASVVYTSAHTQIFGTIPLDLNNDGIPDFNFIRQSTYLGRSGFSSTVVAPVNAANRIEGDGKIRFNRGHVVSALALPANSVVGTNVHAFHPAGSKFMRGYWFEIGTVNRYRSVTGAWANGVKGVSDRYLGLAFTVNGETHFGWARLSVPPLNHQFSVGTTLTGYAYETVANKAIVTGSSQAIRKIPEASLGLQQPQGPVRTNAQTLGSLALGYSSMALWRREEETISAHTGDSV